MSLFASKAEDVDLDQIERDIAQAARVTGVHPGYVFKRPDPSLPLNLPPVRVGVPTAATILAAVERALAAAEQQADAAIDRAPADLVALAARVRVAKARVDVATLRHVESSFGPPEKNAMQVAKTRLVLARAELAIAEMRPNLTPDEARTVDEVVDEVRRALAVAVRNLDRPTFSNADSALALAEADLDCSLAPIRAAVQARLDEQARQSRVKEAAKLAKDADVLRAEAESHFQALDRIGQRLATLEPRLAPFTRPETLNTGNAVFHREMPVGLPSLVAFFCRRVHDDGYLACRDRWRQLVADRRP